MEPSGKTSPDPPLPYGEICPDREQSDFSSYLRLAADMIHDSRHAEQFKRCLGAIAKTSDGLDGLYPTELKRVIGALVARFKRKATSQVHDLFLIIDCEGYTIDLNWDLLAKAGKYESQFCPDVLGISPTRKPDFSQCLERDVVTKVGDYLIATKRFME